MAKIEVALALGGNIGNVEETFKKALKLLEAGGLEIKKVAKNMLSEPEDCLPGTSVFFNSALIGYWNKTPEHLLQLCKQIEVDCGRPKIHTQNSSRTLDIDIITFGNLVYHTDKLIIPHPKASKRFFVLKPLFEIKSDLIFPDTGAIVSELYYKSQKQNS
jgi:2-amino-4-hydroxy-6-hydroxymethyldihydropteridine diphosphokinase